MAGIFHPSRGGTRGGQDQFNWDDVKSDKDREYYLGHTLKAPVGKWQEGKDLMWYTRNKNKKGEEETEIDDKRKKELKGVKDLEARAMAAALGHKSHSSGATSLTAKELQEVLSRGQSNAGQGVVTNRAETSKQKKLMDETQVTDAVDVKLKRSKKRKKEKRKKKKKEKKKKHESDDNSSEEEFENRSKRVDDNAVHTRKKRRLPDSDISGDERCGRRENNNIRNKRERGDHGNRSHDNEIHTRKKRRHSDTSHDDASDDHVVHQKSTKNKHKLVKNSKYCSENESSDSTDKRYSHKPVSRHNSRRNHETYSQPADSHIQFTRRNKRTRHDTSGDGD